MTKSNTTTRRSFIADGRRRLGCRRGKRHLVLTEAPYDVLKLKALCARGGEIDRRAQERYQTNRSLRVSTALGR